MRCQTCGCTLLSCECLPPANDADEKRRRIYYQDIVYSVCNSLDRIFAKRAGHGVVCGTADEPSAQVQALMTHVEKLCADRRDLLEALEYLVGNDGPQYVSTTDSGWQTAIAAIAKARSA